MSSAHVPAFSVNKLMEETRRLASEYKKNTGNTLPISNELGRYDAEKILNLIKPEKEENGVDFLGTGTLDSKKILVKSRVIFQPGKSGQRIGSINLEGGWDILVLLLYDEEYQPEEIYFAKKSEVVQTLSANANKRGIMSVSKFKHSGQVLWDSQNGLYL